MRVGIIGTGSMGGMLARLLVGIPKLTVCAYNRSPEKMLALARHFDDLELAGSVADLVRTCHIIFLCTKTADGQAVLDAYGATLTPSQILATTISALPISQLEAQTPAQVVKVIPSVTQTQRSGICLISYGSRIDTRQAETFEKLVGEIGSPFVVEESQIRVASDLTSCGPAFLAYLLLQWASAATTTTAVSQAEADHLLRHTVMGLADLLRHGMSLQDVLQRVCVPGGVTEAGIEAIASDAERLFAKLHRATRDHAHPTDATTRESATPLT